MHFNITKGAVLHLFSVLFSKNKAESQIKLNNILDETFLLSEDVCKIFGGFGLKDLSFKKSKNKS